MLDGINLRQAIPRHLLRQISQTVSEYRRFKRYAERSRQARRSAQRLKPHPVQYAAALLEDHQHAHSTLASNLNFSNNCAATCSGAPVSIWICLLRCGGYTRRMGNAASGLASNVAPPAPSIP